VLTVIIVIVMLMIGVGLTALYREVGLGRGAADAADAPAAPSRWPFGNLAVGNAIAGFPEDAFTGFLVICADDVDALGAVYSVAVVAEEWGYPLLVAVARTLKPNGWRDRLDGLPGNVSQHEMNVDAISSLKPAALPVTLFLNESRVVDASLAMDSPSAIATNFQRSRSGLKR
jgi:hypothetical protein